MEDQPVSPSLAALEQFRLRALSAALDDQSAFQQVIVEAQQLLVISQTDLADWFGLSRSTVCRWSNGDTAPYPGLRRVIFDRLAKRARDAERRLNRQQVSSSEENLVRAKLAQVQPEIEQSTMEESGAILVLNTYNPKINRTSKKPLRQGRRI